MRILVIGSNGFIGSAVFKRMELKGHNVYGADVFKSSNHYRFFMMDPLHTDFNSVFNAGSWDVCINCAGSASVPFSIQNPLVDFDQNVNLVAKLLYAIKHYQPSCQFIQLSSAAVYGNPVNLPIDEYATVKPLSPYGVHKRMAEQLCEMYYKQFGVKSAILRVFSAFGPGLRKQLFWDIYQKMTIPEFELFGTGNESRDFIYVDDIVVAIECIMLNSTFDADIINVANGKEITIREATLMLTQQAGFTGKFIFTGNERKGDPVNWVADISKLKSMGYTSKISFEMGIKQYVEWVRANK